MVFQMHPWKVDAHSPSMCQHEKPTLLFPLSCCHAEETGRIKPGWLTVERLYTFPLPN